MKRLLQYLVGAAVLLSPLTAHSADLATPPPLPLPVFSWTGVYIGANIGGAWAGNDWTDRFFILNFNNNTSGGAFIRGGQIGGNYQIGTFVIGGEWDFDWAGNNNHTTGVFIPTVGDIVVTNNNRWITTVAARFGWAVDRLLLYGKAGGGWVGNNNLTVTNLTTGVSVTCGTFTTLTNCGNNTGGWLVGAGGEYALTNNWTMKFEYDYLGIANRTFVIPVTAPFLPGDTFTSNNRSVQMFKVGVNYCSTGAYPLPQDTDERSSAQSPRDRHFSPNSNIG